MNKNGAKREKTMEHLERLVERYPALESARQDIAAAYALLERCYENDGKLLIAGNGGSAADAEHMAGELMKKFRIRRKIPAELAEKLVKIDKKIGGG